jgi:hypothetical protein
MKQRYYSFKGEIGSLLYRIIYLGILYLGLKFFGTSILDDLVIFLIGSLSFELVGFILRGIGFWKY